VFPAGRPVQEVEGISVKWINTNGLSLLGPGSEWFWTALSTVAVVVSLLAIYRQIRLQTDVKETQQLNDLAKDWESERIQRLRLAVFLGIKEGKPVREIAAAWRIAGFWEVMGGLARAGHVSADMISETLGGEVVFWWANLSPFINEVRVERGSPTGFEHFEWLADRMRRGRHDHSHSEKPLTPERLDEFISDEREAIALEEALRATTAA
jgi:Domain of unknown function (DUF4760)